MTRCVPAKFITVIIINGEYDSRRERPAVCVCVSPVLVCQCVTEQCVLLQTTWNRSGLCFLLWHRIRHKGRKFAPGALRKSLRVEDQVTNHQTMNKMFSP